MTSRPRVLLVDDVVDLRTMLRLVLERKGFSVVGECTNGAEALKAVTGLAPDVVVMDLNMPEMGGIEATQLIKARHGATRVVFYSAYADASLHVAAAEAGADAWVLKGARISELVAAVAHVTDDLS